MAYQMTPPTPTSVSTDDKTMGTLIHILGLFTSFIGPLIIWLMKKDESTFIDAHGKAALNFHISMAIYWTAAIMLSLILIGIPLLFALFIASFVLPVLAAIAANKGELYEYPLVLPIIK